MCVCDLSFIKRVEQMTGLQTVQYHNAWLLVLTPLINIIFSFLKFIYLFYTSVTASPPTFPFLPSSPSFPLPPQAPPLLSPSRKGQVCNEYQ